MVLRALITALAVALLGGCVSLPPGADFPKSPSTALEDPGKTRLGAAVAIAGRAHPGKSGFRLFPSGLDGFLVRMQMADAAAATLDVQYYIYHQDETSKLLSGALLRAAERGVRVRVLLDDHGAVHKSLVLALDAHPKIEVRLFNPFAYRGENAYLRYIELLVSAPRLKYRMHNKLMVADNTIALVGGRNVGNEYFQASPEFEFGDYDLLAAGPIARELSRSFDDYWNDALAIPVAAFENLEGDENVLNDLRTALRIHRQNMQGTDYLDKLATGEPLASVLRGPLEWADAEIVADNPEKAMGKDASTSWLAHDAVVRAAAATRSELLLVSPYVVPGDEGMGFLLDMRRRNVRVRVLTNSLEATDVAVAHAGYARYRPSLLDAGIELHEARMTLNEAGGRTTPLASGSSGRFSLHAKALAFDRRTVLIGAMNFDKRSLELNTELGLLVYSPQLGQQVARQFDSIANPANSYEVALDHNGDDATAPPRLLWRAEKDGKLVELEIEPIRNLWQRVTVDFLLALPIDVLLGESDYH
ncbi:MAG: phospholipase family protein [Burkholderiales bacterium]|nr:phospholipase family protein [Burkholderiales bacterium]